jgi:hypothetical protein
MKWEYSVIVIEPGSGAGGLSSVLADAGDDGWELATVDRIGFGPPESISVATRLIFKRPKERSA